MRKSTFIILASIMAIVLAGIIIVQVYWIRSTLKVKEDIFKYEVNSSMQNCAAQIQNKELKKLYKRFLDLTRNRQFAGKASVSDIVFEQIDTVTKEKFTYKRKIYKQKFHIPKDVLIHDTVAELTRNYAKKDITVSTPRISGKNQSDIEYKTLIHDSEFTELTGLEREELKDIFYEKLKHGKIEDILGVYELYYKLLKEFQNRGINADFEFGLYQDAKLTDIRSDDFNPDYDNFFSTPLFNDQPAKAKYVLKVYFPDKQTYLLSNMKKYLILSILFILIMSAVFAASLYQLNKQKKSDEIKTDFINNMTHEFKTPITTINLALDSILNPKIITDKERIKKYVEIIRQENKRMNMQVENVLRMAKLEKREKMELEELDMHEIIEDSISHVQLKLSDKDGILKRKFEAENPFIYGNPLHTTNVMVNLLDNAIKYSKDKPEIEIRTYNKHGFLYIMIQDNGIGIPKKAQKHIFDKFYREKSGDVHNTKGHGLGLAYVKKIVTLQHGEIGVVSKENQGSTFVLKFPFVKKSRVS